MKDYLVILESPHKAKTVQKYLGSDYHVVACVGHIRDLAVGNEKNDLGVDIENDFSPIYEISPTKKRIVANLKKMVSESKDVYLATDPDREGEAISWHLAEVLGLDINNTKRLRFHEITYHAVKEAMEQASNIDMNLVSSQETRRILDRILGFRLSQLLQRKIGSKSAGRVQSAVLKLVVDKQNEIDAFKQTTYYTLKGVIIIDKYQEEFIVVNDKHEEIHFETENDALNAINQIQKNSLIVNQIVKENKTRASRPVYTTSTLLQDSATHLKFDSKRTMKIAQNLYEGLNLGDGEVGLITYMRTDSVRITPSFINKTKQMILENYGEEYVGVAKVSNGSNNVQDAHEGIRPTDLSITPQMVEEKANKDQAKLYKLIYNRAVASMMKDEIYEHQEVELKCGDYYFLIQGDLRLFDGFVKVLQEIDKVKRIPLKGEYSKDSKAIIQKIATDERKTKGPNAYSESTLIQAMKDSGIGRPSTYASTLDLIKARDYVNISQNHYVPTNQGKLTIKKLEESFADIINVEYTANMESILDEIAEGKSTRHDALNDFYHTFNELYEKAKVEMKEEEPIKEELGFCPNCHKPLVKRTSRYGSFIACSGYPECKFILNESKVGKPCPKCHEGKLVLRSSKYGKFYACDRYPECDYHESNS